MADRDSRNAHPIACERPRPSRGRRRPARAAAEAFRIEGGEVAEVGPRYFDTAAVLAALGDQEG